MDIEKENLLTALDDANHDIESLLVRIEEIKAERDEALAKLAAMESQAAPADSQRSADAVKAFCKDIGLYDPEYDDQGYIEVGRDKLREHVESLYDRCPIHESEGE